jgi:hypothetical protein
MQDNLTNTRLQVAKSTIKTLAGIPEWNGLQLIYASTSELFTLWKAIGEVSGGQTV